MKVQIESRVLGDLAINHIVPTAVIYQNRLLENLRGLRETFAGANNISVLDTAIPERVAYLNAASLGLPVHRVETRQSRERRSPSAMETMQALAIELFPEWREAISRVGRCTEVK